MHYKHSLLLTSLLSLFACSGNSGRETKETEPTVNLFEVYGNNNQKQYGLFITNPPRQGMQYVDSTGTEFAYRYFTITVINDTIIPIHFGINFPDAARLMAERANSKLFLLPRHLTPEEQQFDTGGMSKELKQFLDFDTDKNERLIKTLKPRDKCTMTFGVLTDVQYPTPTTPYETTLLASIDNNAVVSLKLQLTDSLIVPCGSFSYIKE